MPLIQDGQQVERIVDTYSDTLLRIALHHTQNQSDAEDAVQMVFLKLLKANLEFEDSEHEKAWLIRVTINQCKDLLRSAWNKKTTGLEDKHKATEQSEDFIVLDAVRALPDKYRDIVFLFYYEGYTTAEIAAALSMQQGTVESRLFRARAQLKKKLEGEWA
ncbi:MAG: RNA polymerase sigma factor [Oscillospiraceae bacterium]